MKRTQLAVTTISIIIGALLLNGPLKADVVIFQSGTVVVGNVLQQDDDGVLIQMDYGTLRYPSSMVKDVHKGEAAPATNSLAVSRIPNWAKIISQLATNGWAHDLKQIPATVIDNGVLQNVPYISFRCNAGGYEINVYGDLDNPAGVEIGAINYNVKSGVAKSNCVNFICSVLPSDKDEKVVHALNWNPKDVQKTNGMTFEITLPSEPDAYGGWWISVYDENALTNARATGAELLSITQPRIVTKVHPVATTSVADSAWSSDDISSARPTASDSSNNGGTVYVRGYYRKNGTYVNAYTRRR
ncbi:MAG: hypothetical protein ABSH15_01815 [Verrucomicrobiota bacterium]|jgi:hypothetical protein